MDLVTHGHCKHYTQETCCDKALLVRTICPIRRVTICFVEHLLRYFLHVEAAQGHVQILIRTRSVLPSCVSSRCFLIDSLGNVNRVLRVRQTNSQCRGQEMVSCFMLQYTYVIMQTCKCSKLLGHLCIVETKYKVRSVNLLTILVAQEHSTVAHHSTLLSVEARNTLLLIEDTSQSVALCLVAARAGVVEGQPIKLLNGR
mmetsp:Transcript_6938/g.12335  ORF Transcript_6938/g.12335 Transcript_6938/m.12335 type:complete len:200 (+) Transcript_6938:385-984(+)